jgi:hypothetical protein
MTRVFLFDVFGLNSVKRMRRLLKIGNQLGMPEEIIVHGKFDVDKVVDIVQRSGDGGIGKTSGQLSGGGSG